MGKIFILFLQELYDKEGSEQEWRTRKKMDRKKWKDNPDKHKS